LFLDNNGRVKAMGDDTFGQCGTSGDDRATTAPFFEVRHRAPVDTQIPRDKNSKE